MEGRIMNIQEGMKVRDTLWPKNIGKVVAVRHPRGRRTWTEVEVWWRSGGKAIFRDTDDPSYNRISELQQVKYVNREWVDV